MDDFDNYFFYYQQRQDHYAVLGLSKYRYKATDEQIKKAHRKKVLRHHPDKKAAAGRVDDDSFFKCIQKANEILTDPIRRKQWDSVDEGADVPAPTKKEAQAGDYYDLWGKFFEAEARFSKVHPVPAFGDENSTRDEVEGFYNFFYTFDSWRSFEYQDEDVPDDNENRDQKRQTEKKNMNARRKKKTEDTARLRKMVDEALANDERIKKFRKEGKKKSKKQVEREEELARAKAEKDAEEAKKKEAEAAAAAAHAEAASAKESAKKAKEAAKNAAKKNKRTIRNTLTEVSHFGAEKPDNVSTDVDFIVAGSSPEQLAELVAKINGSNGDADKIKAAYSATAAELVAAGSVKKEYLKFF